MVLPESAQQRVMSVGLGSQAREKSAAELRKEQKAAEKARKEELAALFNVTKTAGLCVCVCVCGFLGGLVDVDMDMDVSVW